MSRVNRSCNKNVPLSRNTQNYLNTYRCILDEMIRGMTHARLCDSISHNFIVQMIPHHKAAIQMARNIEKYTTNPEIEQIACHIIEEQTKSIADMENMLACCSEKCNCEEDLCSWRNAADKVFQTMFRRMRDAASVNSVDCNFLREMIPHHEGAVAFSEITLQCQICPELQPVLESIIVSQAEGICRLQGLLKCICH